MIVMISRLIAAVGMVSFDTRVGRNANVFRQDSVLFPFATSLDRTSGRMVIGLVVATAVVVSVAAAATFIATTTDTVIVNVVACVGVVRSASLLMILLLLQLLLHRMGTCACTTCGR